MINGQPLIIFRSYFEYRQEISTILSVSLTDLSKDFE